MRISAEKRALGLWIRAWQLSGNRWPPQSRAILAQIMTMMANAFEDAGQGELSSAEAFEYARETMLPFTNHVVLSGSEQDFIVDAIADAILTIEMGNVFPDFEEE